MRGSNNNHLDFGDFRFCLKDCMKDPAHHCLSLPTLLEPQTDIDKN